jgi:hypothetical protein
MPRFVIWFLPGLLLIFIKGVIYWRNLLTLKNKACQQRQFFIGLLSFKHVSLFLKSALLETRQPFVWWVWQGRTELAFPIHVFLCASISNFKVLLHGTLIYTLSHHLIMENVAIQILLMILLSYLVKSKLINVLVISHPSTNIYAVWAHRPIFL